MNKKPKRKIKKTRLLILVLLLIIVILICVFTKNKKNDEDLSIAIAAKDKSDQFRTKTMAIEMMKKNGKYIVKIDNEIQGYIINKIIMENGKEIEIDDNGIEIELTEKELEEKTIRFDVEYDKKDARNGSNIITLYKRRIISTDGNVIVEGYIPLDTEIFNIIEIGKEAFNASKIDENYETISGYGLFIEYENKQYNPSDYGENIKFAAKDKDNWMVYMNNSSIDNESTTKKENYVNINNIENTYVFVLKKK